MLCLLPLMFLLRLIEGVLGLERKHFLSSFDDERVGVEIPLASAEALDFRCVWDDDCLVGVFSSSGLVESDGDVEGD